MDGQLYLWFLNIFLSWLLLCLPIWLCCRVFLPICIFLLLSRMRIRYITKYGRHLPPPRPFLFLFKGWGELVATLSRSEPVEAQRSWLNWSFIGLQCKMIMTKACVPSCLLLSVVQSRNCSHLALTAKFLNWHPNYSLATWRPVHLHISGK